MYKPIRFIVGLLLLWAVPAVAQPLLPSTPYTRGFMQVTDQAAAQTYLGVAGGAGDVVGPSGVLTNSPGWLNYLQPLAVFDGDTGKLIKESTTGGVRWNIDGNGILAGLSTNISTYPYLYLDSRTSSTNFSRVFHGAYNEESTGSYVERSFSSRYGATNKFDDYLYLTPISIDWDITAANGAATVWRFSANSASVQLSLIKTGQASAPSYTFVNDADTGMYSSAADTLNFSTGGTLRGTINSSGYTGSAALIAGTYVQAGSSSYISISTDTPIYRNAARDWQFGVDAATPSASTLSGPDGSGTDKNGGDVTIVAGRPTGTGTGGILYLATAGPSTTGSTVTTRTNRISINGTGNVVINAAPTGKTLDVDGILEWTTVQNEQSSLSYSATTDLDFTGTGARALDITGDITFTTSNKAAGRMLKVKILCDGTGRNFTFPAGWKWVGAAAPASIAASKTAILSLECWGSNESDVVAAYAVEP